MDAPDLTIDAGTRADIALVARLADTIWRLHYPGIITDEQIDYMLARGYAPEAPATTKLDKLYVLPARHGRGVGRALIARVEEAARADGSRTLILNVNKGNARAIAAYLACGFATRESVVVDIGGGFVMDDYVMAKAL
jgi:GNAT superfamily N-acetyltransferase